MTRALGAVLSGLLFGLGLTLSGMVDRHRVLGFLDVAGAWDPTLVFVLAAALGVATGGYRLALARSRPLVATQFHLPRRRDVDGALVWGAVMFGVGWGLSGYCPGPGIAGLVVAGGNAWLFVPAFLAGSWIAGRVASR